MLVGRDTKNLLHCKTCYFIPHSFLAHPRYKSKVKHIDSTLQCMSDSPGRIGCGTYENLCIGSTHQKNFRDVLRDLAELPSPALIKKFLNKVAHLSYCFFMGTAKPNTHNFMHLIVANLNNCNRHQGLVTIENSSHKPKYA